jgi:DNA-binding beta-propeller fold protein YncE
VTIAANGDIYAADYTANNAKIIRLDSNLIYRQDLVTSGPSGVTARFRPTGIAVAPDGSLYVQNNDMTIL